MKQNNIQELKILFNNHFENINKMINIIESESFSESKPISEFKPVLESKQILEFKPVLESKQVLESDLPEKSKFQVIKDTIEIICNYDEKFSKRYTEQIKQILEILEEEENEENLNKIKKIINYLYKQTFDLINYTKSISSTYQSLTFHLIEKILKTLKPEHKLPLLVMEIILSKIQNIDNLIKTNYKNNNISNDKYGKVIGDLYQIYLFISIEEQEEVKDQEVNDIYTKIAERIHSILEDLDTGKNSYFNFFRYQSEIEVELQNELTNLLDYIYTLRSVNRD
jgi:hypothetical protein